MKRIHLSEARRLLGQKKPMKICYLTAKGEVQTANGAIQLGLNFYGGVRNFKLPNRQIRKIRDVLILSLNDMEVYL